MIKNMFAVVESGSQQFIVKKGDIIRVQLLDKKEGDKVELDAMLLSEEDGKNLKIGTPYLADTKVEAKVIATGKTDKVRVFKMLRRHRRRVNKGHRQQFMELEITSIK